METMKYSPDALVSLESVLSTVELSLRPSRPADYQAENQALVALTQELVNSPGGHSSEARGHRAGVVQRTLGRDQLGRTKR